MNLCEAYLLGLMCARGHILSKDKRIIIEFAHKNKIIEGIAYCPNCGSLATAKKQNNPNGLLFCKSCNSEVDKSVKRIYEQKESTLSSLKNNIIPFLSNFYKNVKFEFLGNEHMTFLIIDFENDAFAFERLQQYFDGTYGFDTFSIPKELYSATKGEKQEFITGFLDTAGFFNSGNWFSRNGTNGKGRMRVFIQIVRNWKMPVLICNFLKKELRLPVQTIDWGHPNIRDSNMKDYFYLNPLSWSREHQVKVFPEYYSQFKLRIAYKQEMFTELINHNKKVNFNLLEDCNPPSLVSKKRIKAFHPGEEDIRIPLEVRKHFDAYWQVCHNLGCIYSKEQINNAKNPEIMLLEGKDEDKDKDIIYQEFNHDRQKLTDKILLNYRFDGGKMEVPSKNATPHDNPEAKLYKPISDWFKFYLSKKYSGGIMAHDTSSYYLDRFIFKNNLFETFEFYTELKIKPDIVGFLLDSKELCFVEVKIDELTLKDIGQLLGYCLVGNPKEAILVSIKKPSNNLIKILKTNNSILNYNDKKISIGTWDGKTCEILEL